ncbi:tetratricopeptide repeat protein [Amycolatopsis sp. NPDC059021]|uniref:tetratricopeptide repeat protein n=1 Tax=Amycolatopsis sp. NPDC059021 TaxID=3346704 RepID=UPI00366FB78B
MEWERVVAVTGPGGPGSGYVVAPRLVLTSAHVVRAMGEAVTVFRPGRAGEFTGRVVWCGTPGGRDDAALVEVAWTPVPGAIAWGHTVTHRTGIPCVTWGSPDLVQRAGRPAEVAQVSGTFNAGDRMVGDRYVLNLDIHPPEATGPGTSPWGGLSGAAMCCGELVTGVIATDPAGRGHSALEAVPMYVLLRDPAFAALVGDAALEPVELRELSDPQARARTGGAITSPAGLLPARRAVVPFRGREELLGELRTWAESPGSGLWLLHGPGGQGKTRLVHEFAARLGWTTLWLDPPAGNLDVLADTVVPLLVAVDYAETRVEQFAALLDVVARRRSPAPVKIIALARTAGAWWQRLASGNDVAGDLVDVAPVRELPVLDTTASGQEDMYRAAVDAFAAALTPAPNFGDVDWTSTAASCSPPATSGDETVLSVQMTALSDLLDAASPGANAASRGPEDRLLDHERRYWESTARAHGLLPGLNLATLTDAITAAALIGPPAPQDADKFLSLIPGLADQPLDRRDTVRAWLTDLYPSDGEAAFAYLQPDRLAERLIGRLILDRARNGLIDALIPALVDGEAEDLLTFCTRAAAHKVFGDAVREYVTSLCLRYADVLAVPAIDVATQVEDPRPLVAALDRLATDPATETERLIAWSKALPEHSTVLAETTIHIRRSLVTRYRDSPDRNGIGGKARLAGSLHNLAISLDTPERWPEALELLTEAVEIYRDLAAADPAKFLPELANGLNSLSNLETYLGRRTSALATCTEAVEIYRRLANSDPKTFKPLFASTLSNLSSCQAALGRQTEASRSIWQSVDIQRQLSREDLGVVNDHLANSLHNLALRQADLGRPNAALATTTEAVARYRELADLRPDAYTFDLAASLNNLGIRLARLERHEESLAACVEAVDLYQRLVAKRPAAVFLTHLAGGLINLSRQQEKLGLREEALSAATEAVSLFQQLTETQPNAFLPELATSLSNLSSRQEGLGHLTEALASSTKAVEISRRLAESEPDAFLPDFAAHLNTLARRQANAGQREAALAAVSEAVGIAHRLAETEPDAHLPDLASYLNDLGYHQADSGDLSASIAPLTEAASIWRRLAETEPAAHLPALARTLNTLGNRQSRSGAHAASSTTLAEALAIRRRLAEADPVTHLPGVAESLHNLALVQSDLGRHDEALASVTEAVELYRPLAAGDPGRFRFPFGCSLHELANHQLDRDLHQEAVTTLSEAVAIRRELEPTDSHRTDLGNSLNNLALAHLWLGQPDEALRAIDEAAELFQQLDGHEDELERAQRIRKRIQDGT